MSKDEIKAIINSHDWELMDETEHFARYRSTIPFAIGSSEQHWVKHVPKGIERTLESSARNVECWNGIHDLADKAYESTDNEWIAPCLGAGNALDEDVARQVLTIYRDKKYLVHDACSPSVFLSDARGVHCVSVINSSRCGEILEGWASEVDPYYERFIREASSDEVPRPLTACVIQDLRYIERYFPAQDIHADLSWQHLSMIRALRQNGVIPDIAIIRATLSLDPKVVSNFAKKISALQRIGYSLDEGALKTLITLTGYDQAEEIEDIRLSDFMACTDDYATAVLGVRFGYPCLIMALFNTLQHHFHAKEKGPGSLSLAIEAARSTEMPRERKANILKLLDRYHFSMNVQLISDSPELSGLTPLDLVRQMGDSESEHFLVTLDAWDRADFASAKEISCLIDRGGALLPIGLGAYNTTYRTTSITINGSDGLWVVKYPLGGSLLNQNKRAVRKWNKIHTKPEERAYLLTEGRWLAPYCGNEPAPDAAIQLAILDIYRKTGELVKDGCGKNNFLMFKGEAYCVDVGLIKKRRGSLCSKNPFIWPSDADQIKYLQKCWPSKPLTVSTIGYLEYLESCLSPEEIKDTYLTREMVSKLMLVWEHIRVNAAIMDVFVGQDFAGVARFINAYHFIKSYQRLKRLENALATIHDIYCLAYLISLDAGHEIEDKHLWKFLIALRADEVGTITYLAAKFGLLRFLKTWVDLVPASIDMPTLKNCSPVMIAAHSMRIKPPVTRYQVLEFFVARQASVDFERRLNDRGTPYHGWAARHFAIHRRDNDSYRLLCGVPGREAGLAVVSSAGAGFFSSSKAPPSAAPLTTTSTAPPDAAPASVAPAT